MKHLSKARQLMERNWKFELGIDMNDDEFDIDLESAEPEEIARLGRKVAQRLLLSRSIVLRQLSKVALDDFDFIRTQFETEIDPSFDTEECIAVFNNLLNDLYNWADRWEVWAGGTGPGKELNDVKDDLEDRLGEAFEWMSGGANPMVSYRFRVAGHVFVRFVAPDNVEAFVRETEKSYGAPVTALWVGPPHSPNPEDWKLVFDTDAAEFKGDIEDRLKEFGESIDSLVT